MPISGFLKRWSLAKVMLRSRILVDEDGIMARLRVIVHVAMAPCVEADHRCVARLKLAAN